LRGRKYWLLLAATLFVRMAGVVVNSIITRQGAKDTTAREKTAI